MISFRVRHSICLLLLLLVKGCYSVLSRMQMT